LRAAGKVRAERLKHMRWPLLRRGSRVRGGARQKLHALLASKMATARAWDLKETFFYLWHSKSVIWAGLFILWREEFLVVRHEGYRRASRSQSREIG
jgi:Transposase